MQTNFQGTGVAIVTPFLKNGDIDFLSLKKLLNHIIDGGIDFVVALGTTSEAVTLTADEKQEVMAFVIQSVDGRVPIVIGLGGNNTAEVVQSIEATNFEGIDGILSVAPYYNKPNQRGLIAHFSRIAEVSPVPIILYNVPGRTSSNISADSVVKLAKQFENIVAVKEASGDMNQIMQILKNKPSDFHVLSGDDALTFPMMALGSKGVISVISNAFPVLFSNMVQFLLNGNFEDAKPIHYGLLDIIDQLFVDGNPAGVKAALSMLQICENELRLPMVPIEEKHYSELQSILNNFEF